METTITFPFLDDYQYTLMKDPASHIRLLEIGADASDGLIRWALTTFEVNKAPLYHAISYTWGPERPIEKIALDDRTMNVRKNCADVLRQLAQLRTCRYYWLDALCINQANLEEKSAQVAIMGSIFEKASHVLICPGQHGEEGEYVVRTILSQLKGNLWDDRVHVADAPDIDPAVLDGLHVPSGVDATCFADALAALTSRPYFRRAWVVQELNLAREASICFGKLRLPALRFYVELDGAEAYLHRKREEDYWKKKDEQYWKTQSEEQHHDDGTLGRLWETDLMPKIRRNDPQVLEGWWDYTCKYKLRFQGANAFGRNKLPVHNLVGTFSHCECQDPRDTVYGGLALADWAGRPPIVPDYNKSTFELAIEVLSGRIPPQSTPSLLRNLKISRKDSEVSHGVALRRGGQAYSATDRMRDPVTLPLRENKTLHSGICCQLTTAACQWELNRSKEGNGHLRITPSDDRIKHKQTIIAPIDTRPGDWILDGFDLLYTDQQLAAIEACKGKVTEACKGGIVLRPVTGSENIYALTGRAVHSTRIYDKYTHGEHLDFWFDPQAILIF